MLTIKETMLERHRLKFQRYVGTKFNNWLVLDLQHFDWLKDHRWRFLVRCACGLEKWMALKDLRSGKSKSCGKCRK